MLQTRFTQRFATEHPIVSAPMAGHSDGRLAAAVSAAGGLGTFGAMHPEQPDGWVGEQVDLVRSHTDRPFGVGYITPFIGVVEQRFDDALGHGVPVVALSFAPPGPWIDRAHDAGALTICQVQTVDQAREARDSGADAIAAQGTEAGGHTGTMGLLPLLGSVLDACPDIPVLAAGGVADGRTLAGVLAMGADGAWLGTAFLAATEAPAEMARLQDLIVASDGGDTTWTRAYDIASGLPWPEGIGERVRRNDFTDRWEGREEELRASGDQVGRAMPGHPDFDERESGALYGQSAAFVSAVRSAAAIIDDIVTAAERRLDALRRG